MLSRYYRLDNIETVTAAVLTGTSYSKILWAHVVTAIKIVRAIKKPTPTAEPKMAACTKAGRAPPTQKLKQAASTTFVLTKGHQSQQRRLHSLSEPGFAPESHPCWCLCSIWLRHGWHRHRWQALVRWIRRSTLHKRRAVAAHQVDSKLDDGWQLRSRGVSSI